MKLIIIFIILYWFMHYSADAEILPKGTHYDQRIQYVLYNPDNVVLVKTRTGNSTLIQLASDEFVINVPTGGLSLGDTGAWSVAVRGNNIFLKPRASFPNTNINLVTNKHTYAFSLIEVKDLSEAAWQIRFKYPDENIKTEEKEPCSNGYKNWNWFKYGDNVLAPSAVWDDGEFTCMKFPINKAVPIPYRYTPTSSLKEALVNFHWKDDVMVIHEVNEEFRLRLGNQVLGIKTDALHYSAYNKNQTSTGQMRVKKG
jgi:type IV secretion system protein VirB9